MRDDAFAIGLHAEVLAYLGGADDRDDGVPREVDGLGARLVWFPGAGAGGAHGSPILTHHAGYGAVTCRYATRARSPQWPATKNTGYMRMSEAMRRTGRAARATGGAVRSGARAGATAPQDRRARAPGDRRLGAGRTGLSTLIELTAAGGAGDAFVAVSLAGTIFFSTSVDQARGKVVLFLLVTMAPFAVLAPFIGPALDRMQQGRRYLLAGTLLARGLLCWGMSAAINSPVTLLPAAFGILVLQKAYGVARASVTPRLLPAEITLVTANARSQLITLTASMLGGAVAAGIQATAGSAWVLRAGTVIYLAAMFLALRLPDQVDVPPAPTPSPPQARRRAAPPPPPRPDSYPNEAGRYAPAARPTCLGRRPPGPAGQPGRAGTMPVARPAALPGPGPPAPAPRCQPAGAGAWPTAVPERRPRRPEAGRARGSRWRGLGNVGPVVGEAMRGNAVLRAFSGYMVFFLAFLLRTEHFGVSHNFALGALVAAAAAGGLAAMAIGSLIKRPGPAVHPVRHAHPGADRDRGVRLVLQPGGGDRGGVHRRARRRAGQAGAGLHRAARDRRGDPVVGLRGLRDAEPGGERGGQRGRRAGLDAGQRPGRPGHRGRPS